MKTTAVQLCEFVCFVIFHNCWTFDILRKGTTELREFVAISEYGDSEKEVEIVQTCRNKDD